MLRIITICLTAVLVAATGAIAQNLDGAAYQPGVDPDVDMYMSNWQRSMPRHSHGSLIERDIFTKGDPMNPPRKGAVLRYIDAFAHATLHGNAVTTPTTLEGQQEIFYFLSGKGTISAAGETHDVYEGIGVLVPAGLEFVIENTTGEPLTAYLLREPIPEGFRPNAKLKITDENTQPVSTGAHWVHIWRGLFGTADGLGTLESIGTVTFDPMTIGHPHSHEPGCEEAWTAIEGESTAFIGKQIRKQPPGTGYLIPPDGETPHSNINESETESVKLFYFARYREHEVRP